jgi:AcrR family transcriptional regulator
MEKTAPTGPAGPGAPEAAPRRLRADAQRNIDSLLEAAKTVFGTSGVDAPAKEIADLASVGVGTLYRHFPQRSDLVKAVFQREVDACAAAAPALTATHDPGVALTQWLLRYTEFLATKRGLATALHSGDPAFDALPGYFMQRLGPVTEVAVDHQSVMPGSPWPTAPAPSPAAGRTSATPGHVRPAAIPPSRAGEPTTNVTLCPHACTLAGFRRLKP